MDKGKKGLNICFSQQPGEAADGQNPHERSPQLPWLPVKGTGACCLILFLNLPVFSQGKNHPEHLSTSSPSPLRQRGGNPGVPRLLCAGLGDHPAVAKLTVDLNWGGGKKTPNL